MTDKPAVVLLSGGLDSTTALAIARAEGYEPYALSFRYGQRHTIELEAAHRVAQAQSVARHVIADIDLRVFGGSALTDDIEATVTALQAKRYPLLSPGIVTLPKAETGFHWAVIVRDPDGHAMELAKQ